MSYAASTDFLRPALPLAQQVWRHERRLKELEAENTWFKKLLADSILENEVTREALRKKW